MKFSERTCLTFLIVFLIAATGSAQKFSWQTVPAKIKSHGDLEYAAEPFKYQPGESVRYIDFENGSDNNSGETKSDAWKHHPWDPKATGNAALANNIHTYVFKKGVVYRGRLEAKNTQGEKENPIILTADPGWGKGEAALYGSRLISGGWQKATAEEAPQFKSTNYLWYIDLENQPTPRAIWEVQGKNVNRIPIARHPNWEIKTYADIKSEWFKWQHAEAKDISIDGKETSRVFATDPLNLIFEDETALEGVTVWTEYVGVMGTPYAVPVEDYDPSTGTVRFERVYGGGGRPPIINCRYFLENSPLFLDSPGEYYYEDEGEFKGRLYLRLPGNRNPNESQIEVAADLRMIDIFSSSNIKISGLTFRFMNIWNVHERSFVHRDATPAVIRAFNNCANIEISNCTFEHVPQAIFMAAEEDHSLLTGVVVKDNRIAWTDHSALEIKDGSSWGRSDEKIGVLHRVSVLRNELYQIGPRPIRSASSHALKITNGELVEIAGNFLNKCYGAGIFVFGGKSSDVRVKPLIRMLIHHNRVTDPLLNTNDWGGIETWQGGPAYVFNNVSENPGGYWYWKHVGQTDLMERTHNSARFGFAYYLDGAFKNYLFNNIAIGHSNDLASRMCNSCGLQEIIGFQNAFFNNSFYKFGAGSRRQAAMAGRNYYLSNIWQDMGEYYFRHAAPRMAEADQNVADAAKAGKLDQPYDYKTMAYKNNIFFGNPREFGVFEHTGVVYPELDRFANALKERETMESDAGVNDVTAPMPNAPEHDFSLSPESKAIDRGTKFFVPWSLYGVVGEWHFYPNKTEPLIIHDEHWYMTDEYKNRSMYRFVPRNDLRTENFSSNDFVEGNLENWTNGALPFDGESQFCFVEDEVMKSDYSYDGGDKQRQLQGSYEGENRKTLDMDTNSFLIEMVFNPATVKTMPLVSKSGSENGYRVHITEKGKLKFIIHSDGKKTELISNRSVEANKWYHVIAEADRKNQKLNLYIDGKSDNSVHAKRLNEEDSLANSADFLVGKSSEGLYFEGKMDFLRVARGSIQDAETTIEELFEWQFNGPFLKDFTGFFPKDGKRDAGAIEYRKSK